MGFFSNDERAFARTIAELAYCNPFLPERIDYEKEALGEEFVEVDTVWSKRSGVGPDDQENVFKILALVETLTATLREKLASGARVGAADQELYQDLILFLLYHRHYTEFKKKEAKKGGAEAREEALNDAFISVGVLEGFEDCARDYEYYFSVRGLGDLDRPELHHVVACFFQIRRAFHHIFECIIGESLPTARLRAAIWQSIFTHDMRRYRRALYRRMADVTTLVTGPSGTGKELVARSIALSRYIPFDARTRKFSENYENAFFPLNLAALSPTLIESELFGHRRGAFTGALQDRAGWFEVCPLLGTVFLDEMGEVDAAIQVKLLRVLESRKFQRLGDTRERAFQGKVIAATNRDLAEEMRAGRFRRDLYYRLCSDIIVTPSLCEQLRDSRALLPNLAQFIAERLAGEEEAPSLAEEVIEWIGANLEEDYPWPGNFRELEQCARNIMIRKTYHPARSQSRSGADALARALGKGEMTADELMSKYCALVYAETKNYQETARRLNLDHRTVKSKIQSALSEGYL